MCNKHDDFEDPRRFFTGVAVAVLLAAVAAYAFYRVVIA